jgi:PilZ domain-containing protein
MEQKRFSPRRRVLKAGLIAFEGATFDCTIRNVSVDGAGIELGSLVETPVAFRLIVEADDFIRMCRVAWRHGARLGVRFA